MSAKRMRNFFKYYGSKHRIAPLYPTPAYADIIEPFAGSASYATAYFDRNVILVERDPDVAALWSWLVRVDASEVRALPIGLPEGLDIRTLAISPEAQLLIRYNQRIGMSRCWTVSKWGNASGFWDEKMRDAVAAQVSYIRHWRVFHGDLAASDPPAAPATWFIDPPYQTQAAVYRGAGGPPDFARLAVWAQALRGQVIVCEAPGATWLPFRHLTMAQVGPSGSGVAGREKKAELIWTGGLP